MKLVKKMSETALQQHTVKLLEAYARPEIEWHCVPNGAVLPWKVAKELKLMGVKPGVADLMFLIDGLNIAVELKTEIGEQSSDQTAWQETFERAGGKYFIAFGLDQVIGVLKGINAFRPNITFTTQSANAFAGRAARSGAQRSKAESRKNSSEVRAPA